MTRYTIHLGLNDIVVKAKAPCSARLLSIFSKMMINFCLYQVHKCQVSRSQWDSTRSTVPLAKPSWPGWRRAWAGPGRRTRLWSWASNNKYLLWNYQWVLDLLVTSGCVVAVMAGHDHDGGYHLQDGVHQFTLSSPLHCSEGEVAYGTVGVTEEALHWRWYGEHQQIPSTLTIGMLSEELLEGQNRTHKFNERGHARQDSDLHR